MNFAEDQRALLKELIKAIQAEIVNDLRVDALWLSGSLGRGEGDSLSDIDLLAVGALGSTEKLVESPEGLVRAVGPVAFVYKAPHNAPLEGTQWNVLYDTNPLPVYVDWNIWPPVERRPSDVAVLFERKPFMRSQETFASMQSHFAKSEGLGRAVETLNHFRVMMIPVLAKKAARGEFESVSSMLGYMRLPDTPLTSLEAAVQFCLRLLKEYGASESDVAISTIKRYVETVRTYEDRN